MLLAGIDEAGFGPLLGPLTVGFAAFRVADAPGTPPDPALLWERLRDHVAREASAREERIVVADSKALFARTERGKKRLEQTCMGFFSLAPAGAPRTVRELVLGPQCRHPDALSRHPWYGDLAQNLPAWMDPGLCQIAGARLARALSAARVEFLGGGVEALFEGDYNRLCRATGNKSMALWEGGLGWVRRAFDLCAGGEGLLVGDRQGGRARYGSMLARGVPEASVRMLAEREGHSAYLLQGRGDGRRLEVHFTERGDQSSFATALASCFAKYARELCMDAFNAHFQGLEPELGPTAGYTADGRRWLEQAAPALARAGLTPADLVRER